MRSLTWICFAITLSSALIGCKHPLEIVGEGHIVDLNNSGHGCSYTEHQDGYPGCTENNVSGDYDVYYQAVPAPGWRFVRWEGPCAPSSVPPYCRLEVKADAVSWWDANYPDAAIPATVAVFEKIVYDRELRPTGEAATDVANLRAALAAGGILYLRARDESGRLAAFELGGEVLQIERSVTILGEFGGNPWTGRGMTRLVGGRLESHVPGTRVEVRGIHFVDSVNGAIDFRAGHDITIAGNRITAATMQGQGIHEVGILPLQTVAVNVGGELYADPLGHTHTYADITGTVQVTDNYANTEEAGVPLTWPADKRPILNDIDAAFSFRPTAERVASWLTWREVAWHTRHFQVVGAAADVVVVGNRSVDSPGIGIQLINGHGRFEVSHNRVTLSPASDYYFGAASAGIAFFDSDVSGEHAAETSVNIEANRVTTRGIHQCGIAFSDWLVRAQALAIRDNDITLSPTAESNPLAVGLYGEHSTAEVSGNRVSGEGTAGIWLNKDIAGHASGNVFANLNASLGDFVVYGESLPPWIYRDLDLGSL